MSTFCPNCGKPVEEGVKFCQFCGNPIPAPAPAPEAEIKQEVPTAPQEAAIQQETPAAPQETPAAPEVHFSPAKDPIPAQPAQETGSYAQPQGVPFAPPPPAGSYSYPAANPQPQQQAAPAQKQPKKEKKAKQAQQAPAQAPIAETGSDLAKPASTGAFFLFSILFAIPGLGLILAILFSLIKKINPNIRHFARANLILLLIGLILSVAGCLLVYFLVPGVSTFFSDLLSGKGIEEAVQVFNFGA